MGKGTRVYVVCAGDAGLSGAVGGTMVDAKGFLLGVKLAYVGCDARDCFVVVVGHECFCRSGEAANAFTVLCVGRKYYLHSQQKQA